LISSTFSRVVHDAQAGIPTGQSRSNAAIAGSVNWRASAQADTAKVQGHPAPTGNVPRDQLRQPRAAFLWAATNPVGIAKESEGGR